MKNAWLVVFWTGSIFALPQNPCVINQECLILQSAEVMEIMAPEGAVIEWGGFSIDVPETVRFSQPSSTSAVLNRVVGTEMSHILGKLEANGHVLIINQNGILFGKDSIVDVGGLIASTLDLNVDVWQKSRTFQFTSTSSGSLESRGQIRTQGPLCLLAHTLFQEGTLQSEKILLFAGNSLTGNLFAFEDFVPTSDKLSEISVQGNLFAHAGEKGGEISIFGDWIQIEGMLNASGSHQGGIVHLGILGDDWAQGIYQSPSSQVLANCTGQGDGGRILFMGNEIAQCLGTLGVEGGVHGGDGGFIEVSSKGTMDLFGSIRTGSPLGKGGTFLIDPLDLTIAAANVNVTLVTPFIPTGAGATLNALVTLIPALGAGSVIVRTVGTIGPNPGNIMITAPITWVAAGNTLLIDSANDISVSVGAPITSTGAGSSITMQALGSITILDNVTTGAAPLTMTANLDINIGNAAIVAPLTVGTAAGTITLTACRDFNVRGGDAAVASIVIGGRTPPGTSGDIILSAGRDMTLTVTPTINATFDNFVAVTRLPNNLALPVGLTVSGDITLNVGHDLLLQGHAGTSPVNSQQCNIGHGMFASGSLMNATGDYTINVGNDMILQGANVGADTLPDPSVLGGCKTIVRINVARDLLTAKPSPTYPLGVGIGNGGPPSGAGYRYTYFITVGRNYILDGGQGFAVFQPMNDACLTLNAALIAAYPPLNVIHVGGDLIFLAGDLNFFPIAAIRHHGQTFDSPMLTRIRVGGNILCYNSVTAPATLFIKHPASTTVGSYDIQAGGDIQIGGAPNMETSSSPLFSRGCSIISDAPMPVGTLWAPMSVVVCGTNIFAGTLFAAANPPFSTNNPAVSGGDGRGAVSIETGSFNNIGGAFPPPPLISPGTVSVNFASFSGDLVVQSRDLFESGAPADFDIGFGPNAASFSAFTGNVLVEGFRDTYLRDFFCIFAAQNITVITQRNMHLIATSIFAGNNIDLVCDNAFPARPLIGPGFFTMDATSSIFAGSFVPTGYTRIYTARQSLNTIDPLASFFQNNLGPFFFSPGTLFVDTNQEMWCIYYPEGTLGVPFRVFYKDCFPNCSQCSCNASCPVMQFLVDLHPYNEFPGWTSLFWVTGDLDGYRLSEPYYFRRRQLNLLKHPKTWSQMTGGHWAPLTTSDPYFWTGIKPKEKPDYSKIALD